MNMSEKSPVAGNPVCNENGLFVSSGKSIGEIVSARAAEHPTAPAVVTGTAVLTYEELDQRANQLANHLTSLGVRRETIVAICLDRSFESIISALAVLKAGGAYLPIDPKLPIERFNYIMSHARPRVLITGSHASGEFDSSSLKVINLRGGEHTSAAAMTNDQLAYVIYTSGSTGKPKGVEITVGNLRNLVSWHQSEFKITAADRASHLAAVGFDAAVWEVWPYLTAGASLYLPDEATRLSPEALRDWLVTNEITISFLPTTLAESLIDLEWPKQTALRFLLTGADTLHRRPTKTLPFELVNNYGPTECTVVTRVFTCSTKICPKSRRARLARFTSAAQTWAADISIAPNSQQRNSLVIRLVPTLTRICTARAISRDAAPTETLRTPGGSMNRLRFTAIALSRLKSKERSIVTPRLRRVSSWRAVSIALTRG